MTQLVAFPEGMQYRQALKITDALMISDTESPDKGQPEYTYLEDIREWLTYKIKENENGFLTGFDLKEIHAWVVNKINANENGFLNGLDLKEIHAWVANKISANENNYLTLSDIEEIREKLFEQDLSRINAALQNVNTAINDTSTAIKNTNTSSKNADDKASLAEQKTSEATKAIEKINAKNTEANALITELEALRQSLVGQYKVIPQGITLDYSKRITLGNTVPQKIKFTLLPSNVDRNVLFLGDNNAISITPNGEFLAKKAGISVIHALPTENTAITKTIQITVVPPSLRKADLGLRLMGNGNLRLT